MKIVGQGAKENQGACEMNKQRFESVWGAISDTPGEAANLKARSALIITLTEMIKRRGLTQAGAAKCLGVTQPRISDLMRGKIDLFSLDTLVNMLDSAGMRIEIRIEENEAAPA
jgi:predicted XRE-type DNA-binding protein